jgi:spore maturation protein CgeB
MADIKKILVIGHFSHFMYEKAVCEAIKSKNIEVVEFPIDKYLKDGLGKIEYYFSYIGIISHFFNRLILKEIAKEKPDVVLFWRCTLILNSTLKAIKSNFKDTIICSFNNDDPFSPIYKNGKINQRRLWINFKKNIPFFDINFVYRPQNIRDYNLGGSKNTFLLPPYFINSEINSIEKSNKLFDVVFLGHPEPDRIEYINYLLEKNINITLFGEWNKKVLHPNLKQKEIFRANGSKYFQIINDSKISIAFLSKLNRDVYTRRNFEIPALGGFMLSERTKELHGFFEEGKDAEYFSTKEELLEKVQYYLKNLEKLETIAKNGQMRSIKSGYEIKLTIQKYFLEPINNYLHSKEKTK